MKKAIIAVLAMLFPFIASAAVVEVMRDGQVRLNEDAKVVKRVEVAIDPAVFAYGDAWKKAFRAPGTLVSVQSRVVRGHDGPFHSTARTVTSIGVINDAQGVRLVRDVEGETVRRFSPFVLLVVIGMAAGAAALYFLNRKGRLVTYVAFVIAAFASIVAFILAFEISTAFAALFAFVVAVVGAALVSTANNKLMKILGFLYEGSMSAILAAFLLF